jgi:hypothetical protein
MIARALPVLALSLLAVTACSSSGSSLGGESEHSEQHTGKAKQAVIKGKPSDASQDAVVLLVYYDPNHRGFGQCTGTLLAPRLVLTARHCVSSTDMYAACTADGDPISAGAIFSDNKPDKMFVFTGKDRPQFGYREQVKPAGVGMKILHDGGKNLCNHDLALIVLKDPIKDVPIAPIRLDDDVVKGEKMTAIGWGVTDTTPQPDVRQQRKGVKINAVGPAKNEIPAVPPNEFQVGESICSGDSGGPAISEETGAVIGVVSRGGNMEGRDQQDPAAGCIDGYNLYSKIAPFKDTILQGYELAEAEPWIEGGPDPRKLKPGSACSEGDECRSALCLADPSQANATTCAQACTAASECGEGNTCATEGENSVCRAAKPASKEDGGLCSGAPGRPSGTASIALVLAALAIAGAKRRRK